MHPILTFTMNPTVDLCSSVDNIFPNHKLRCNSISHYPGGGGINVSRAIKRMGGESLAVHCSGGPIGAMVSAMLSAECISQEKIEIKGWTRENFTIVENASGQQYRFVMPGPTFEEEEWRRVLDLFTSWASLPRFIVASGSLPGGVPDDFYARLARIAKTRSSKVIVDSSGPALEYALREGVFLIKPSLRELQILTGKKLRYESEQREAALELVSNGHCDVVVLSLGAGGLLLASADGCEHLSAPVASVQSRIGAGDCMVGGIVLGLLRGYSLREAVRYGGAAGSAAVMNPGTELCHREDVERLFGGVRAAGKSSRYEMTSA